jgi:hypothetical protein
MGEHSFQNRAGAPVNESVTLTAGQGAAWGALEILSGELRGLTLAAEGVTALVRNLDKLGQGLERLDRLVQALDKHL